MPKVTILVSVYNKAETICACIESLLRLTYPEKKIMVVEGYSHDNSYENLKKYQNQIESFRIPGNYSQSLNWALDRITTEYTVLTDADCVVAHNWVEELLKGFDQPEIVATTGYCGTPSDLTGFQRAIGLELESRFRRFPEFIVRAPTMNLCLKTEQARNVRFDENIQVGIETDFGYRLTKQGKMRYMPEARVWHYHRSSLGSYFQQQKEQAAGAVRTYLRHPQYIVGDHISTSTMIAQVPLAGIALFSLLISFWFQSSVYLALTALGLLVFLYVNGLLKATNKFAYYPALLLVFVTRTLGWLLGSSLGLLSVVISYEKR